MSSAVGALLTFYALTAVEILYTKTMVKKHVLITENPCKETTLKVQ